LGGVVVAYAAVNRVKETPDEADDAVIEELVESSEA
jgi:hypothetical protein